MSPLRSFFAVQRAFREGSAHFPVQRIAPESRAVLLYFHALRVKLFVLGRRIISVPALRAGKSDACSRCICHGFSPLSKTLRLSAGAGAGHRTVRRL